jgi:DNA-directed RNA polymerase specialized sigma24 family protein
MDDSTLEYPWVEYASFQERAGQIQRLSLAAWAIEDLLNEFLDSFSEGSLPVDREAREKRQKNLLINRQKKHSHRLKLVQEQAVTAPSYSPSEPIIHPLIIAELLIHVRASTTEQEWRILVLLAFDYDYATVAQNEGMSVTALKTKVSRCRQRLRVCLAA